MQELEEPVGTTKEDALEKLDDYVIQVTKVIPETVVTKTYEYDYLLARKARMVGERDVIQAEIDELDRLISECDALGIRPKEEGTRYEP